MNIENVVKGIGGILMFGGFGTLLLINYLQFQRLIYRLENMGGETVGEIINIYRTKFGRYNRNMVAVEFIADGATILAPEFMVDLYTSLYVGQQVYVQFYKYNPQECLIKETPDSDGYINNSSLMGGTLGLLCASACYILAAISIGVIFVK